MTNSLRPKNDHLPLNSLTPVLAWSIQKTFFLIEFNYAWLYNFIISSCKIDFLSLISFKTIKKQKSWKYLMHVLRSFLQTP